ncbi:MAG: class I SAM-dependent methyltransferase [Patescibacteria group bacterium]|nr:class I SAM-dependent methyltransferase [Patescibacteria group bacterium]
MAVDNVWKKDAFCSGYFARVKINTDNVHYGWLAPGEKDLKLLGCVKGKKILEIACGAAQNSIALAKQGAICTGIDISPAMLRRAKILAEDNRIKIELLEGDCSDLLKVLNHPGSYFDIIISSYGVCLLGEIGEIFRQINFFLKMDGNFTFCGTHPQQIPLGWKKDEATDATDNGGWQENYLTINEAISCLSKAGFLVRRIVEQITINPSHIPEAERNGFPYVLLNPDPRFDEGSERPHTIIYSCQKVETVPF